METPFFFNNGSYRLFGVLHEPKLDKFGVNGSGGERKVGVVICSPLAEEKVITQRIIVNLARTLSREGIFCLRFDYFGSGDSEGKFEESTLETMLSDIHAAVATLKTKTAVNCLGILGVRFGGTLATLFAETSGSVDWLMLVEPILDGKSYMLECLRSNLTLQMAAYKKIIIDRKSIIESLMAGEEVSIDGYQLTKALYEQISDVNLIKRDSRNKVKRLVIGVGKKAAQRTSESLLRKRCRDFQTEGCDVRFEQVEEVQFWLDQRVYKQHSAKLEEVIVNWIRKDCLVDGKYKEHEL